VQRGAGRRDAVGHDARFEDLIAVDQRHAGLADPLLADPFRQSDIRRI
jgi:hypothetical protein